MEGTIAGAVCVGSAEEVEVVEEDRTELVELGAELEAELEIEVWDEDPRLELDNPRLELETVEDDTTELELEDAEEDITELELDTAEDDTTELVVEMLVNTVLEDTTDELDEIVTGRLVDEVAATPFWYTLSLFPAPQYSVALSRSVSHGQDSFQNRHTVTRHIAVSDSSRHGASCE